MTLEQVRAAKPSADCDVVYGERDGQTFVEAAYRTLASANPLPTRPKGAGGSK